MLTDSDLSSSHLTRRRGVVPTVEYAPHFSLEAVGQLLRKYFAIDGRLTPLSSERDQNFLVRTENGGARWIFKITNAAEKEDVLELQHLAIEHLVRSTHSLRLPMVHPTTTGKSMIRISDREGHTYLARVLSYVEGVPLAEVRPWSAGLLESLGRQMAVMGRALETFEHPAMDRPSAWDIKNIANVRDEELELVDDTEQRAMLARILECFDRNVSPHSDTLRRSVIHGDWNEHNILVDEKTATPNRGVVGAIDFGDLVRTWTIADLAIALAYAMMNSRDPIGAAAAIVRGYHSVWPLPESEVALLLDLTRARLCISALNAARGRRLDPDNVYLQISQEGVWRLIAHLETLTPEWTRAVLRDACGWPASARSNAFSQWVTRHRGFASLIDWPGAGSAPAILDLSVGSLDVLQADLFSGGAALQKLIADRASETEGVAIGRYGEARLNDGEEERRSAAIDGTETHTVHLGVDVFAPAGTNVRAPLAGSVHSVHLGSLDATNFTQGVSSVLTEHKLDVDGTFYILYRHLDQASISEIRPGEPISAGEVIGCIAGSDRWPSHVHVQVLLEPVADARSCPSLARPSQRRLWQTLCPDPSAFLGLRDPSGIAAAAPALIDALLEERRRFVSDTLSISYRRPLAIIRGNRQYLFDTDGRRYLDCVNNVAHVGHSHPVVVRAVHEQLAALNTNTRYLHRYLIRYAERLSALMPAGLNVCFFVCSGSEANELALRLARAHRRARFPHTKHEGFIVIDHAYHGNTGALIELSPYKCEGPGGRGLPAHVRKVPAPDPYRGLYRTSTHGATAGPLYARHLHDAIDSLRTGGLEVAAFLSESVLGCGGQIVPPDGYFSKAYQAVRDAGGVCIADEVQVGFGRVGEHFWGFEMHGVVPDIVTMGKPIGNGFPLGAVVTTPGIAASFVNGMEYFNTYGGNPVACAAGLAVLDVVEREGLQNRAKLRGQKLLDGFNELQQRHPLIGDVRGRGLFLGIELVNDRETLEPAQRQSEYIVNRLCERGILLSTDGPLHNVIKCKPPLVFDEGNVAKVLTALDEILSEDAAQPEA